MNSTENILPTFELNRGFAPATKNEIESWNYRIDIENQAKKNAKKLKKHNSKEYPYGTQSKRTF